MTSSVGGFRDFVQDLRDKHEFKAQYKAIKNSESGTGTIKVGDFEVNITVHKDRSLPRSSRKTITIRSLDGSEIRNISIPFANRKELFKMLKLESTQTALQAMQSLDLNALKPDLQSIETELNEKTSQFGEQAKKLGTRSASVHDKARHSTQKASTNFGEAMKTLGEIASDKTTPPALKQAIFNTVSNTIVNGLEAYHAIDEGKSTDAQKLEDQSTEKIAGEMNRRVQELNKAEQTGNVSFEQVEKLGEENYAAQIEMQKRMPTIMQFSALCRGVEQFFDTHEENRTALAQGMQPETLASFKDAASNISQRVDDLGNAITKSDNRVSLLRQDCCKKETQNLLEGINNTNLTESAQKIAAFMNNETKWLITSKTQDLQGLARALETKLAHIEIQLGKDVNGKNLTDQEISDRLGKFADAEISTNQEHLVRVRKDQEALNNRLKKTDITGAEKLVLENEIEASQQQLDLMEQKTGLLGQYKQAASQDQRTNLDQGIDNLNQQITQLNEKRSLLTIKENAITGQRGIGKSLEHTTDEAMQKVLNEKTSILDQKIIIIDKLINNSEENELQSQQELKSLQKQEQLLNEQIDALKEKQQITSSGKVLDYPRFATAPFDRKGNPTGITKEQQLAEIDQKIKNLRQGLTGQTPASEQKNIPNEGTLTPTPEVPSGDLTGIPSTSPDAIQSPEKKLDNTSPAKISDQEAGPTVQKKQLTEREERINFRKNYEAIKNSESGTGTITVGTFEVGIVINKKDDNPDASRKTITSIKTSNGFEIKNLSIPFTNRKELLKNLQLKSIKTESPELQSVKKALQAMQSLDLSALQPKSELPAATEKMADYLVTLTSDIAQKKEELGATMKTLGEIASNKDTPPALKQAIFDAVGGMAKKGFTQAQEISTLVPFRYNGQQIESLDALRQNMKEVNGHLRSGDHNYGVEDLNKMETEALNAGSEVSKRMPDLVQLSALNDLLDQFDKATGGAFFKEREQENAAFRQFNFGQQQQLADLTSAPDITLGFIFDARKGLAKKEAKGFLATIDPKHLGQANPEDIQKFKELIESERLSRIEAHGDDNIALLTKIQRLNQRITLHELKQSGASNEQIVAQENVILDAEKQIAESEKRKANNKKTLLENLDKDIASCQRHINEFEQKLQNPEISPEQKSSYEKGIRTHAEQIELYRQKQETAPQEIAQLNEKIALLDAKLATKTLEELDAMESQPKAKAESPQDSTKQQAVDLSSPKQPLTAQSEMPNESHKTLQTAPNEIDTPISVEGGKIEAKDTNANEKEVNDILKSFSLTTTKRSGEMLDKLKNIANSEVAATLSPELIKKINNRIEAVELLMKIDKFVEDAESMYQLNSDELASKTINISNEDIQKFKELATSEMGSEFTHAVRTKLHAVNQWAEKKFDEEIFNRYGTTRSQWLEFVRCDKDEEKINAYKKSTKYTDWKSKQDAQVRQLGEVCQKFLEPFKSISDAITQATSEQVAATKVASTKKKSTEVATTEKQSTTVELSEPIKSWPEGYEPLKKGIKPLPDNFEMLQNTVNSLPDKLQKKYDYVEGDENKTWTQKLQSQKMTQGTPDTVKEKEAKVRSALHMTLNVQPDAVGSADDSYWHDDKRTSNGLGLLQGALGDKYIPAETKEEINYYLNAVNLVGKFNTAQTESEKMECVYTLNEIANRTSSPGLQRNIRDKLKDFWSSSKIERTALEWL